MKASAPTQRPPVAPRTPAAGAPILVLDTGSPISSLALGVPGPEPCRFAASFELRRTSEELLSHLRTLLNEARLNFSDLGGIVALQGPGSFTGLRIGLATALGFHQALRLPVTALPTLPVLALWGLGAKAMEVTVAIDALRGDFYAQVFQRGNAPGELLPQGEARLYTAAELALSPGRLVGFGLADLLTKAGASVPPEKLAPEPPALAPLAFALLPGIEWEPGRLIQPIYFRAPAVTVPKS